jgi:hypothetical protein
VNEPHVHTKKMLAGLKALMQDTGGWGVLLLFHPPGDVPFLTPVVPKLRGYEIVASPTGTYDLWQNGCMRRSGLTKPQVQAWLAKRTPPDPEFEAKVALWTEQTLDHYGVPKR